MSCHDIPYYGVILILRCIARSCHVMLCHVMSCHDVQYYHVILILRCITRSCHAMPCHGMAWHVISCLDIPYYDVIIILSCAIRMVVAAMNCYFLSRALPQDCCSVYLEAVTAVNEREQYFSRKGPVLSLIGPQVQPRPR